MKRGECRFCGGRLATTFVDLGMSPLSNSFLEASDLGKMEPFFPLHVFVCDACLLVQLEEFEQPEAIFSDYAYFSSFSDTWLRHASDYVDMTAQRFGLGQDSLVVEIASNDGYLLQYFVAKGVPVLGIEPAANVAAAAEAKGVPTISRFFGRETARALAEEGRQADLLVGNNVLAHVPDINDFVAGLAVALKPEGVITMEFPHLMQLIEANLYDTIYHEHFSYLSFHVVQRIFEAHGLTVFDVEEIPTHGGSLRVFARHAAREAPAVTEAVGRLVGRETTFGIASRDSYLKFRERVEAHRWSVLEFLIRLAREGKRVVGYGAPAKGNTLLNYCGVRRDLLAFTVDRNPRKQGRYLPGSHIPIEKPDELRASRPDYVVILPWNIKDEIMEQVGFIREWGGRFAVLTPRVEIIP